MVKKYRRFPILAGLFAMFIIAAVSPNLQKFNQSRDMCISRKYNFTINDAVGIWVSAMRSVEVCARCLKGFTLNRHSINLIQFSAPRSLLLDLEFPFFCIASAFFVWRNGAHLRDICFYMNVFTGYLATCPP